MKYFSQITSGNTVLMGAKTFESIGKPLKNRYNIVVTRREKKYQNWQDKSLVFTSNLKGVLEPYKSNPNKHIFIIGGREIYQQTYLYADYYYVSIIKREHKGNVFFPFEELKKQKGFLPWNEGELEKKKEYSKFTIYIYNKTQLKLVRE
jgi:dihydrofolate reductase